MSSEKEREYLPRNEKKPTKKVESKSIRKTLDNDFDLESEVDGKLEFNLPREFYDQGREIVKIKIIHDNGEVEVIEGDDLKEYHINNIKHLIEDSSNVKKVVVEQISDNNAKRLSLLYSEDSEISENEQLGNESSLEKSEHLTRALTNRNLSLERLKLIENKINERFEQEKRNDIAQEQLVEVVETLPEPLAYKKQTYLRKEKKDKIKNPHYFKVKNHRDLFKIGNSFYKDVNEGIKSFSFSNIKTPKDQQQTIFGLSAFFNTQSNLDVTIVTNSVEGSYYLNHLRDLERKTKSILGTELTYEYFSVDGINILELTEFQRIFEFLNNHEYTQFLKEELDEASLIFWDLPEISVLDKNKEVFFPITMLIEKAAIVVKKEKSKIKEISDVIDYYNKYNVDLKGILISRSSSEKKKGK